MEPSNLEHSEKHSEMSLVPPGVSNTSMDMLLETQKPIEGSNSSSKFKTATSEIYSLRNGDQNSERRKILNVQKKRFRWFMNHGATREEAEALCQKPFYQRKKYLSNVKKDSLNKCENYHRERDPVGSERLSKQAFKSTSGQHWRKSKAGASFWSMDSDSLSLNSSQRVYKTFDKLRLNSKRLSVYGDNMPLNSMSQSSSKTQSSSRYLTENQFIHPNLNPLCSRKRRGSNMPFNKNKNLRLDFEPSCNVTQTRASNAPNKITMPEVVAIGILHSNYPEELLSDEDMETIQETIIKLIIDEEDVTVHPRFYNAIKREGYIVLYCKDEASTDWLKSNQEKLILREGAMLKVVRKEDIKEAMKVKAYFGESIEDSTERILKFVEVQNEGLKATAWKLLQRELKGVTVILTMLIDKEAAEKIQHMGPFINFKFNKAKLHLIENISL